MLEVAHPKNPAESYGTFFNSGTDERSFKVELPDHVQRIALTLLFENQDIEVQYIDEEGFGEEDDFEVESETLLVDLGSTQLTSISLQGGVKDLSISEMQDPASDVAK